MNILFIGDIVGRVGKLALKEVLPSLKKKYKLDFIICNGENISYGRGITYKDYLDLLSFGVDSITLGNHYVDKREELMTILTSMEEKENNAIILPINSNNIYLDQFDIEQRSKLYEVKNKINIRVTSVLGKTFMKETVEEPYNALMKLLSKNDFDSDIHIIDFHGETSGEKYTIMKTFSDYISAFIGTHTHCQTNDYKLIDNKTLFITDVGMVGPSEGIYGYTLDSILDKQVFNKNVKLKIINKGKYIFNSVLLKFNDDTLLPESITPINLEGEINE